MRKSILLALVPALLIMGCAKMGGEDLLPSSDETSIDSSSGEEDVKLVIDYQHDGGANVPTEWNDADTAETVREGSYEVNGEQFKFEFVGKWYNSTNKQEFQTKKDVGAYFRSASTVVVKRLVVEVFSADAAVYSTADHTGAAVTGSATTAVHSDGTALSYTLNSANWSVVPVETYKGSNVNFYSFTFYF